MTPVLALGLIAAIVAMVLLTIKYRIAAIAVVIAATPLYVVRFSLFGIPSTLLEVLLLSVVLTWFIIEGPRGIRSAASQLRIQPGPELRSPIQFIAVAGAALLLIGALSVLQAPSTTAALGLYKAYIVEPILFSAVVMLTVRNQSDMKWLFGAAWISAGIIIVLSLIQFATGWNIPEPWNLFPERRATAIYGYPNAVGLFIAPLIVAAIAWLWKRAAQMTRWQNIALITFIVAGITSLTLSRIDGALIAIIGSVLVLAFFTARWRWPAIAAGIIGLVIALSIPFTREILLFQDVSGDVRLALWTGTVELIRAQPLYGAGLSGFPIVYDEYRLDSHVELLQYPHNILFNFWTELGIAGALWIILMLAGIVLLCIRFRNQRDGSFFVLLGVFVSIALYGLVDVPYFKNDLAVLFWVWLSLFAVELHALQQEQQGPQQPQQRKAD